MELLSIFHADDRPAGTSVLPRVSSHEAALRDRHLFQSMILLRSPSNSMPQNAPP